jgi:hypothetical protein
MSGIWGGVTVASLGAALIAVLLFFIVGGLFVLFMSPKKIREQAKERLSTTS